MLIPIFCSSLSVFSRIPVICLQRAYDPCRSRKPHPHCSPNRHLGVCCYRLPSAHRVVEQTRWEKIPDEIKEKAPEGACCLNFSFCPCVFQELCVTALKYNHSVHSCMWTVSRALWCVCIFFAAQLWSVLHCVIYMCAQTTIDTDLLCIHEAMGFNIRP